MDRVQWARNLARGMLEVSLPDRWAHTQGVARAAESIADVLLEDGETLVCAAWLHDIGYSIECDRVGFHPLDGARWLRDMYEADQRLCRLVANHTCARIEAENRGLADALLWEFPPVNGLVADALTYCDMTTSPKGERVEVRERLEEILSRYGEGSIVAESIKRARPEIEQSAKHVETAISWRRGAKS
ncbi:MAG TPA: HD domain-containing protein [Candidatus Limnocylindrales bacterium]